MTIATEDMPSATQGAASPGRVTRLLGFAARHPYLVVGVVALTARTAFAIATFSRSGYLIPDEAQYVELARTVASGKPSSAWDPSFGPLLYWNTWSYTGVLRFLFAVLGPSRLVAQLYPAVAGSVVAVFTTVLARRLVAPTFAVLAGLVVALMPSQVLWSSVALREAIVWAAVAAIAVLCALAAERSRWELVPIAAGISLAFLALHALRDQTLVAAVWAVMAAGWFGARRRAWRGFGGIALGIGVPLLLGLGLAGADYVKYGADGLGVRRAQLAVGADSAVTDLHEVVPAGPSTASSVPSTAPGSGPIGGPVPTTTTTTAPGEKLVGGSNGATYVVDDTSAATIDNIPRGLMAFLVRPLPWEATHKLGISLARVEGLLWFGLYGLAIAGAITSRRREVIAFPVFYVAFVVGIAAVSQGNVGTAFRHRAQILWALAVLAVVPLERWWERHGASRTWRRGRGLRWR